MTAMASASADANLATRQIGLRRVGRLLPVIKSLPCLKWNGRAV
jgi:hypothetical protein